MRPLPPFLELIRLVHKKGKALTIVPRGTRKVLERENFESNAMLIILFIFQNKLCLLDPKEPNLSHSD